VTTIGSQEQTSLDQVLRPSRGKRPAGTVLVGAHIPGASKERSTDASRGFPISFVATLIMVS
jgi:hypothetical protein